MFNLGTVSLEDIKQRLTSYESFQAIIDILVYSQTSQNATTAALRRLASKLILELRRMLGEQLESMNKRMQRHAAYSWQYREASTDLQNAKFFSAGLRTHEEGVIDFLLYRVQVSASTSLSAIYSWSVGDAVPASLPAQRLATLPTSITEVPHELRDPISADLMEDPVIAADGHFYARSSITEWFKVRHSSPMTGLPLATTALSSNQEKNATVNDWISGKEFSTPEAGSLIECRSKRLRLSSSSVPRSVTITFVSKFGSFERTCSPAMSLHDLYVLAFRGLRAKYGVFALAMSSAELSLARSSGASISTLGIDTDCRIEIKIAEDEPTRSQNQGPTTSNEKVLIKVWEANTGQNMAFAFWLSKNTSATMATINWQYHRWYHGKYGRLQTDMKPWTGLRNIGDGWRQGTVHETSKPLSTILNHHYCKGSLEAETVYEDGAADPTSRTHGHPLVLKVEMSGYTPKETYLSRLDVLKQMFEALINRTLAYSYNIHLGLMLVGSKAEISMPISHVIENFRKAVNGCTNEGDTALWDGIALARDLVNEHAAKWNGGVLKRILVISDGADTRSVSNTASECAWNLRQDDIVLDSVSLGNEVNHELRTISHVLGSYAMHPQTLSTALQICELEPVLSLTQRPDVHPPLNVPGRRQAFLNHFNKIKHKTTWTIIDGDTVPPRRQHGGVQDQYVQLAAMARHGRDAGAASRSNLRESRLLREMRQTATQAQHPNYDIYVSESDFSNWKIVMKGPSGSPYSDGTFMIFVAAGKDYPTHAPEARFLTPIMHPNVNFHGRICHGVLSRDWVSDMSMSALLNVVFGLLLQPEATDLVSTNATLDYHHDEVEWAEAVRHHVQRHAIKSRAEWKAEILEQDVESDDEEMGGE